MTSSSPTSEHSAADDSPAPPRPVSRRGFVAGAGAVIGATALGATLTACGTEPQQATLTPPSGAPAGTLAAASDIPVGGGAVAGEVVITQPTAGHFEAFTAKCTHAGCALTAVRKGTIDCPCHGSKFHLDGSVANGPADRPLTKVAVRVDGPNIVRA